MLFHLRATLLALAKRGVNVAKTGVSLCRSSLVLVYSIRTPCVQSINAIYVIAGIPAGARPASIPMPLNGASSPQRQEAPP